MNSVLKQTSAPNPRGVKRQEHLEAKCLNWLTGMLRKGNYEMKQLATNLSKN